MNALSWLQYIIIYLFILILSVYRYIKSRFIGKNNHVLSINNPNCRIAIIGGGIGGAGAAYALLKSGYKNVTIYEAHDKLGGNARTHNWKTEHYNITTGLSVLAWPTIFYNYIRLLKELNIETTTVQLPFFIHNREENHIFAHGKENIISKKYKKSLERWKRMTKFTQYINEILYGREPSLYHFSLLNPLNFLSMRLLSLLFGVSNDFWNDIVVPMYASSFLSTKLTFIPSSILPTVDSLISLQPNQIPTLQTWCETSIDVFDRMTEGATIETNNRVRIVNIQRNEHDQIKIFIDNNDVAYDRIIFACNSNAIVNTLRNGNTKVSLFLKVLLSSIMYSDDDENDTNLLDGIIHRDKTILPNQYRNELTRHYANYIDVKYEKRTKVYYQHNTFILSSWMPNVRPISNKIEIEPMFVTYAAKDKPLPNIDETKVCGKVDNRRAHPSLSFRNQTIALLVRLIQGENGMYFCGNAFTPANGHDLSLISGFATAELIGAKYPFYNDNLAFNDYKKFKRMCF